MFIRKLPVHYFGPHESFFWPLWLLELLQALYNMCCYCRVWSTSWRDLWELLGGITHTPTSLSGRHMSVGFIAPFLSSHKYIYVSMFPWYVTRVGHLCIGIYTLKWGTTTLVYMLYLYLYIHIHHTIQSFQVTALSGSWYVRLTATLCDNFIVDLNHNYKI